MTANIFMSYSRREVGFVDDLVSQLETKGHNVWLDYRTLVPGTPWADQIKAGLERSDTVLLVVSKASLASEYVELEWRHFLETNKRVILLVFEAVDLPKELEKYEWVDFRGNYKKALAELFSQLDKPIQEDHPVPERGFKIPLIVWVAAGLSVLTAFYSLTAAWALFVPWFLVPLPYRIFKRSFNFTEVQAALLILPVALFLTALSTDDVDQELAFQQYTIFLYSLPFIAALFFILRSSAMQRWGKPEATLPKFANPYKPDGKKPQPISFFIDHAPQDRKVAEEMSSVFQKHGHQPVADASSAQAVVALLSAFKTDTEADPQKQVVFPVLLQSTEPSKKLSKVQWIDFRSGVRNLDAMAQLLPEPAKLLKALGIRPLGKQLILPPIVMTMRYYVLLLGIFTVGAVIQYWNGITSVGLDMVVGIENADSLAGRFVLNLAMIGVLIFFMLRHLVQRKGFFASFWTFLLGLIMIGLLISWQSVIDTDLGLMMEDMGVYELTNIAASFPLLAYFIGGFGMLIFFFRRRRDIHRWFPSKAPKTSKK